jgi:hypothetical protein
MRTGCPKLDISNSKLTRAFSSSTVRYCWPRALFSIEGCPWARLYSVVVKTSPQCAIVAHVPHISGEACARTLLALSMLSIVVQRPRGTVGHRRVPTHAALLKIPLCWKTDTGRNASKGTINSWYHSYVII